MCIAECGFDEIILHCFKDFPILGCVWRDLLNWLAISGAMHCKVEAHAYQFGGISWGGKGVRDKFRVMWLRVHEQFGTVTISFFLITLSSIVLWWLKRLSEYRRSGLQQRRQILCMTCLLNALIPCFVWDYSFIFCLSQSCEVGCP